MILSTDCAILQSIAILSAKRSEFVLISLLFLGIGFYGVWTTEDWILMQTKILPFKIIHDFESILQIWYCFFHCRKKNYMITFTNFPLRISIYLYMRTSKWPLILEQDIVKSILCWVQKSFCWSRRECVSLPVNRNQGHAEACRCSLEDSQLWFMYITHITSK